MKWGHSHKLMLSGAVSQHGHNNWYPVASLAKIFSFFDGHKSHIKFLTDIKEEGELTAFQSEDNFAQ